ncbi:hypothetical protein DFH07DRAFT_958797 [Mycena maculata]|uniref:Uncharacterized protein n=1 Tax=Mycena maculata TaxID=230809 RepID=A0AAD7NEQ5_9AGAR|nr:hypothetical protein DFH07DRAFT_958797 [Mycena maculata]
MGSASDDELDPREVFPPDMAKWIRKQFSDFDAVHAAGGDESDFKNNKFTEFRTEFGGERCDAIQNCKRKFKRKFANRADKLRKAAEKQVSGGRSGGKPFYLLPDAPETKARDLYKSAHRDEIIKEANKQREVLGQDHHHQPAHFQQVVKERWDGLSSAERETWVEAAAVKNADATMPDATIFENQEKLLRMLFGLLQGTLHAGRGGIGVGAYHLLYSYRNSEEKIAVGSLTVNSAESETLPFQAACVDYEVTTEAPWERYSHQNVGFNTNIDHSQKLSKNTGRFYVLPPFDEETGTLQEYRNTMRIFFEASFCAMPAMPWKELLNCPEDFLDARLIANGILIRRPDAMPSGDLRAFAQCIHDFQAANTTSSIFSDEHIISAAILSRKALAEAAKPQDIEEIIEPDSVDHSDCSPVLTPLVSPASSPHITPAKPVSSPPPKSGKRKASGPPPPLERESTLPLRRSTRHNKAPIPSVSDTKERPQKRRKMHG